MKTQADLEYTESVKRVLDIIINDLAKAKDIKDHEVREITISRLEEQRKVLLDNLTN